MSKLKALFLLMLVALSASALVAQVGKLSAAEIVNKNIQAKGGMQLWHSLQSLKFVGKMQAGAGDRTALKRDAKKGDHVVPAAASETQIDLPFVLEMKRSRKMRVELDFNGKTAVQVYDGTRGWKMRPFLNRTDYEPYNEEEARSASEQQDLDGPLVDYATKGTQVELAGIEKVDSRDAYKLKLTMKDGRVQHVWIDSQTFLEAKIEGTPRKMDGKYRKVEIYNRDYRKVNGMMFPGIIETHTLPGDPVRGRVAPGQIEKITIGTIEVNPKLDDALFTKPATQLASNAPHSSPAPATKHP